MVSQDKNGCCSITTLGFFMMIVGTIGWGLAIVYSIVLLCINGWSTEIVTPFVPSCLMLQIYGAGFNTLSEPKKFRLIFSLICFGAFSVVGAGLASLCYHDLIVDIYDGILELNDDQLVILAIASTLFFIHSAFAFVIFAVLFRRKIRNKKINTTTSNIM